MRFLAFFCMIFDDDHAACRSAATIADFFAFDCTGY